MYRLLHGLFQTALASIQYIAPYVMQINNVATLFCIKYLKLYHASASRCSFLLFKKLFTMSPSSDIKY